jgi:hypothetical protein
MDGCTDSKRWISCRIEREWLNRPDSDPGETAEGEEPGGAPVELTPDVEGDADIMPAATTAEPVVDPGDDCCGW